MHSILTYLIICPLVGIAGFVDAIAGGGGLISLPAYLIAGIPVIWEFAATGLVPRLPSALLAVALVFVGILAFASGLILDTVVKGTRKEYELQVTQAYERYGRRRA